MNISERILSALSSIVSEIEPDIYTGTAREYITFNFSEIPDLHAESRPGVIRYLIQIHWYLPWKKSGESVNPHAKKKQMKNAIAGAGFTYPTTTNASDGDGQHYVFECEGFDGDV